MRIELRLKCFAILPIGTLKVVASLLLMSIHLSCCFFFNCRGIFLVSFTYIHHLFVYTGRKERKNTFLFNLTRIWAAYTYSTRSAQFLRLSYIIWPNHGRADVSFEDSGDVHTRIFFSEVGLGERKGPFSPPFPHLLSSATNSYNAQCRWSWLTSIN